MFYYEVANYKSGIWKGEGWELRQIGRSILVISAIKNFKKLRSANLLTN